VVLKFINFSTSTTQGWTALHFAAKNGNIAVLNLLVKHGANINVKDIVSFARICTTMIDHIFPQHKSLTPLHVAIDHDASFSTLTELVHLGASVDVKDHVRNIYSD
jgi:hypothetical protein